MNKPRAILGIDPGTKCGYTIRYADGRHESGVWDLSPRRHEGGGMRYFRLRSYLMRVLEQVDPCALVYEEVVRHMGTDAAHIYGGIVAVLTEQAEGSDIPYRGIPVATVKKFATGKGNADKTAMVAAARSRWPDDCLTDDNECDARFIAEAFAAELEP